MNEPRIGSASDDDCFERTPLVACPHCGAGILTEQGRTIMFRCETTATDGIVYRRHNRCRVEQLERENERLKLILYSFMRAVDIPTMEGMMTQLESLVERAKEMLGKEIEPLEVMRNP